MRRAINASDADACTRWSQRIERLVQAAAWCVSDARAGEAMRKDEMANERPEISAALEASCD